MRHLPSAQEDRDEEKEGGGAAADVTHQTDVPLYNPASLHPTPHPLHDYPVSLKLEGGDVVGKGGGGGCWSHSDY